MADAWLSWVLCVASVNRLSFKKKNGLTWKNGKKYEEQGEILFLSIPSQEIDRSEESGCSHIS